MRTVYEIRDTTGALIAEHVRVQWPDGAKRMYWQTPGNDPRDGLCGLGTADLPLYGSERIGRFEVGQVVVLTEGEKATDALLTLGIDALGTVTGASGRPGEDALAVLLPFDVVTWEDHDEPGAEHMRRVAASLLRLGGRARRIAWGHEKGDDAADFVERGGTRVTADLLIQAADPWRVEPIQERAPARPSYDRSEGDWRVQTARAKLADVAQDRLGPPHKREGRSLFWRCPFHDEKTASFKVDLKEPFFRCFGCDARGDVFAFLERLDGAGFRDVLRELAPERLLGAAIPW
jgi:DNA primase